MTWPDGIAWPEIGETMAGKATTIGDVVNTLQERIEEKEKILKQSYEWLGEALMDAKINLADLEDAISSNEEAVRKYYVEASKLRAQIKDLKIAVEQIHKLADPAL